MNHFNHGNVIDSLAELGLQRTEALVYLAVLRHGEAPAGVVIDELRMHREQAYRALKRMVADGLLNQYEKDKKAYFSAVSPEVLVTRMRSKAELAESLMPYLHELRTVRSQLIQVTEGDRSLHLLFEDILKTVPENGTYSVLGGIGEAFSDYTRKYFPKYARAMNKKSIHSRMIAYQGEVFDFQQKAYQHLEIRFLPVEHKGSAPTVIYGSKVVLEVFDYETPDNLAVITIENENVARSYAKNFDILWKLAQPAS